MKLRKTTDGRVAAHITFDNPPPHVAEDLLKANRIRNPLWIQARNFSGTGWVNPAIPEWLDFAWCGDGNELHAYRGLNVEECDEDTQQWVARSILRDNRTNAPCEFPKFQLTPSKEQQYLIDAAFAALKKDRQFGNLLLLASTAVGKTLLQAMLAAKLGQRTIVLSPTELITEAWFTDLCKLFNWKLKDIGVIKQSKWQTDRPFCIASIATLHRRKHLWDELHENFGTLVVDEVQGLPAPSVYDFVTQFPARYLIGATATVERNGRIIPQVRHVFGLPVAQIDSTHASTTFSMPITKVDTVETNFQYEHQDGNLQWHDLAAHLAADEERNKQIVAKVAADWADGKVCIVVTKTHEHVEMLCEMLAEAGVKDINRLTGKTNLNKVYTRGLLKLVNQRNSRLLVSTLQAVSKGANIKALDSLHIVMPPASPHLLEQLLGRLRRKHDGLKTEAIVTWYLDVKVPYMCHLFYKKAVPIFSKMEIPGYKGMVIV